MLYRDASHLAWSICKEAYSTLNHRIYGDEQLEASGVTNAKCALSRTEWLSCGVQKSGTTALQCLNK